MQINVIHIYGGSGSGTSTWVMPFPGNRAFILWIADDYLWLPTNPAVYSNARKRRTSPADERGHKRAQKKWLFPVLSRAGEILSSPCLILPFVW
mgnify:CR=1 FL=1